MNITTSGSEATAQNQEPQAAAVGETVSSTPEVKHAITVRRAVMTADYSSFFRLYRDAPHLGRALMDGVAHKVN
jgi:hypothetical protein